MSGTSCSLRASQSLTTPTVHPYPPPKTTNHRYAPGRITNMGSAIPKTKGVPRFTVLKDFVACDEPDPNMVRATPCSGRVCVGFGF